MLCGGKRLDNKKQLCMSSFLSSALHISEVLKPRALPIINLVSFLILVLVNVLGTVGAFGGTNASISNKYTTMITPAGYAFSIWGLIYCMVAVFVLINFVVGFFLGYNNQLMFSKVGILFAIHCFFPSLWTVFFNLEFLWTSVVIMAAYFITILIIYLRIDCSYDFTTGFHHRRIPQDKNYGLLWKMRANFKPEEHETIADEFEQTRERRIAIWEFIFVQIPFSLQLGWISIAMIANISIAFKAYLGTQQLLLQITDETWSIVVQTIAICLSFLMISNRNDFVYTGVITWAIYAVAVKQTAQVSSSAWSLGSVAAVMTLFGVCKFFYDAIIKELLLPRIMEWYVAKEAK